MAELIDSEVAQESISILSRAIGLPVQMRDSQGVPLPSNGTVPVFCSIIRSCRRGLDLCRKRALAHCPQTVGATACYHTHCGVQHLVAPVLVQEERIGAIVLGPLLTSPYPYESLRQRAGLLNLPEDRLLDAAKEIPHVSEQRMKESTQLLSSLSVFLSKLMACRARNIDLELERRRGVEEISMLRHIVNIINSGLDVERTLRSIAEFAVQMTGSDAATIRLRERDDLVCRVSVGLKTEEAKRTRVSVGKGLTGRVVLEKQPISAIDAQCSEEAIYSKFLVREHLHGYLSVPIRIRGNVVGVLTAFRRKRYRYSEQDIRRLRLLADETAIAIDNALLYEERVRAEKRASLLAEAGKIFSSSLDLDTVLQMVTQKLGQALDVVCSITLADEDGRSLVHKASFHRNPAKVDLLERMLEESPERIGVGLAGRVLETGKLLFIDGGGPDSFPDADRPYFHAINMTSAIAVPLRTKDRVSGVLSVAITDSDRRFEEGDVALVQSLAERASFALENAQLYRKAEAERVRLEAVISGMADGVVIVDRLGNVLAINRAGWEIFGRHGDLRGLHISDVGQVLSHDEPPYPFDGLLLNKVLKEGVSVTNAEMSFRRSDGELRICQISAAPVRDYGDAITGAVAVVRDVTALKEIERLKDELISVVSHEFRAPLTAISGYTQMLIRQLSRKQDADREIGELNLVLAHTQRLIAMVRDLLDVSRLQSGQLSLDKRRISLPALVRAVAERLGTLSDTHTISVRAPKDFPPIDADPERIEQVLRNLIGNAIKYSPGGGQVLVTVKIHREKAVVSVRDWGIGIEHKYLPKLFERFYRVDNKESREFEGVGLGLHVAKLLVEAHNGHIWASSRKGQGSTFSFSLPFSGGNYEQGPHS